MTHTLSLLFGVFLLLLCSCMTEREYQLRKTDLDAKKAHAPTYTPLVLTGPVSIEKDAQLVVTVPSQPFTPAEIPSDAESIRQTIQGVTTTAAIVGGAAYGIHKANGSTNTTNNYNGNTTTTETAP